MRNHTCPPLDSLPQAQLVHGAIKNPKASNNCLPLPISQSTPASISSISPQSSSDLDTNHADMIDKTIKHATHAITQTLLTSNVSNTSTNKASDNPHGNTPDLQPTKDVNLHTIHTQTNTKSTNIKKTHLLRDNTTSPVTTFEQTKQIILDIDTLSHCATNCATKSYNH